MSIGSRQSNQGFRTEQAKRMVVRYIWDLELAKGDKLPPYEEFRKRFGLGDETLKRAIGNLEESGVLETRRRVGTYVVDPDADGMPGRIIGLVALRSGDRALGPFYSCLLHYLQTHLREKGCQAMVFYQNPTPKNTVSLSDFPGLQRAISHNEIESLILTSNVNKVAWQQLENSNMHPCFVGAPTPASRGVFIDMLGAMRMMVQDLLGQGCRRPAVAIQTGSVHGYFLPDYRKVVNGKVNADPDQLYFTGDSIPGGREIANRIIAMRPGDRPDGIAVLDDQIGLGLASQLAREIPGYSPRFACMVNKQAPIDLPFKNVDFYEVDIDALAKNTVSMMMKLLRGKPCSTKKIKITPKMSGEVEACTAEV